MENTLPNLKKARNRTKEVFPRKTFYLEEDLKTIGKGKLYYVRTYGCQNNVRDGENIKGLLEEMGYKETSNFNKANIVILNTCAVRENAEKKVFGEVGFLKNLTKKKDFIFGICGCMAQEENVIIEIIQNKPYINFVFGTFNLYELPQIIKEYLNKKKQIIRVNISQTEMIEDLPSTRDSQVKGYVNISYGCDKFCTYCIVPYTRGKLRSRSKEDILKEVNDLVKKGYKEVVLLGQNVNSYGVDKNDGYTFVNLLEDVCKTNIERVRFTSNNPWNFSKKAIDLYKKYKNLMSWFHLPIQSGSETMLKKMNREMKISDYTNLIKYIRKNVKDCVVSTDLIVGFPNETEKEFKETLKLYKKIKYDNAYTFIYSKKEGTYAATIDDKLTLETKKERLQQLNELVQYYSKLNNEKFVGKILKVLVEGESKNNESMQSGYSEQWKLVNFKGNCKIGDIVDVKIISASRFSLNGEIIDNNEK